MGDGDLDSLSWAYFPSTVTRSNAMTSRRHHGDLGQDQHIPTPGAPDTNRLTGGTGSRLGCGPITSPEGSKPYRCAGEGMR